MAMTNDTLSLQWTLSSNHRAAHVLLFLSLAVARVACALLGAVLSWCQRCAGRSHANRVHHKRREQ